MALRTTKGAIKKGWRCQQRRKPNKSAETHRLGDRGQIGVQADTRDRSHNNKEAGRRYGVPE